MTPAAALPEPRLQPLSAEMLPKSSDEHREREQQARLLMLQELLTKAHSAGPAPLVFAHAGIIDTVTRTSCNRLAEFRCVARLACTLSRGRILVGLDGDAAALLIEFRLGGPVGETADRQCARGWTGIELGLLRLALNRLAPELAKLDQGRTSWRVDAIATEKHDIQDMIDDAPPAMVGFTLSAGKRSGRMELAMAADALVFGRSPDGQAQQRPPISGAWSHWIAGHVSSTRVTLDAAIDGGVVAVARLASLTGGALLPLAATPDDSVYLRAGSIVLCTGSVGQSDGRYCLRIEAGAAGVESSGRPSTPDRPNSKEPRPMTKVAADEAPFQPAAVGVVRLPAPAGEPSVSTAAGEHSKIMEISVSLEVVLGTVSMTIAELSRLGPGSVVTLERRIGEPVDVHVNGRPFATGELMVIEDLKRLAVRLAPEPKPAEPA